MDDADRQLFPPSHCDNNPLATLPARVTRIEAARLLKHHYFNVSPRTLERWPLRWRVVNGHADRAPVARAPPIAEPHRRTAEKDT